MVLALQTVLQDKPMSMPPVSLPVLPDKPMLVVIAQTIALLVSLLTLMETVSRIVQPVSPVMRPVLAFRFNALPVKQC